MILESKNESISLDICLQKEIALSIKREDLLHPEYGGNKIRKLKYHLEAFLKSDKKQILTYGGAWSNHIYASAGFFNKKKIKVIGIIRGEEPANPSHTLRYAREKNMQLRFVSRSDYRNKTDEAFLQNHLKDELPDTYIIPEGGSGELGDRGCREIMNESDSTFDIIACPMGTGSTFKGIWESLHPNQLIYGFPALKGGEFFEEELIQHAKLNNQAHTESFKLITDYHFGGYAKVKPELIEFTQAFYRKTKIKLDPVYTSKMMFGLLDLIERDHFPRGTSILAIHTGGLQGSRGIEERLGIELYPSE